MFCILSKGCLCIHAGVATESKSVCPKLHLRFLHRCMVLIHQMHRLEVACIVVSRITSCKLDIVCLIAGIFQDPGVHNVLSSKGTNCVVIKKDT